METKPTCITHPSNHFEWRYDQRIGVGKLSKLTLNTLTQQNEFPFFGTLEADGDPFQGFAIKSDKTGDVTYWQYFSDNRDNDTGTRYILGYTFIPHPYTVYQHPQLNGWRIGIMNDLPR